MLVFTNFVFLLWILFLVYFLFFCSCFFTGNLLLFLCYYTNALKFTWRCSNACVCFHSILWYSNCYEMIEFCIATRHFVYVYICICFFLFQIGFSMTIQAEFIDEKIFYVWRKTMTWMTFNVSIYEAKWIFANIIETLIDLCTTTTDQYKSVVSNILDFPCCMTTFPFGWYEKQNQTRNVYCIQNIFFL